MVETLERGLSQLSGDRVQIRSVRVTKLSKSASLAIHRVDVQLESGHVLPVIFKDLNPLRQRDNAKHIRGLELDRSRREIWMYRNVLPRLALGTPRLYGYRWEPEQGTLWLLVEDVGGTVSTAGISPTAAPPHALPGSSRLRRGLAGSMRRPDRNMSIS